MNVLLFTTGLLLLGYYCILLFSGEIFRYIRKLINKEETNFFYKIATALEIMFLILMFTNSQFDKISLIYTFMLTIWLLGWAVFVPLPSMIQDPRKVYLFIGITIILYGFLTYINAVKLWV